MAVMNRYKKLFFVCVKMFYKVQLTVNSIGSTGTLIADFFFCNKYLLHYYMICGLVE